MSLILESSYAWLLRKILKKIKKKELYLNKNIATPKISLGFHHSVCGVNAALTVTFATKIHNWVRKNELVDTDNSKEIKPQAEAVFLIKKNGVELIFIRQTMLLLVHKSLIDI